MTGSGAVRALLLRGMLAGLVAGLIAFGLARVAGEPSVDAAIAFESAMHQQAGEAEEPEIVSREVQASAGLLTGVVTYGTALGGLFGLACAAAQGRMGRLRPRAVAAVMAGAGFVVLVLAPQIKYPANPPSIGEPDTIGVRTALYFGFLLVSVLAACASAGLGRSLSARLGSWYAAVAAGLAYIACMLVTGAVLAPVNEVPAAFPADLLWRFRLASLGTELLLWTVLGLVFGALAERLVAAPRARLVSART